MRYPLVSLELFPLKFSVKPGTPRRAAEILFMHSILFENNNLGVLFYEGKTSR